MVDISENMDVKMRRMLKHEFARMEDDFDDTRDQRKKITDMLMSKVEGLTFAGESADTDLRIATTALKALSDTESANARAIGLKQKQNETEIASANATKDRLAAVIAATAPGRIEESFPAQELESHLEEMFGSDIKPFELKTNSRDLSE